MAVIRVSIQKRTGGEQLTGGRRVRVYSAVYRVQSNSKNEDPQTILAAPGLPTLASSWPSDLGAFCVGRKPEQRQETPDFWDVTCDFTSSPDIRQPDDVEENPLLRPPTVDRSPVSRQRIVTRDVNGEYVLNSAGEPPNPPWEREEHVPSFSITKNMANWPAGLELALTDSINSGAIAIPAYGIAYPAKVGKCNGFSGRQAFENNVAFWTVTVEIELDWEEWNKPLIDAGYNYKKVVSGTPRLMPIIGENGERPAMPVLLNGSGAPDPYRATPYLLPYKKYREVSHAALYALFGLI
jgi:hypothetical protein